MTRIVIHILIPLNLVIALQIFLVALSIIFIPVTVSLYSYSIFSAKLAGTPNPTSVTTLAAPFIFVKLIDVLLVMTGLM